MRGLVPYKKIVSPHLWAAKRLLLLSLLLPGPVLPSLRREKFGLWSLLTFRESSLYLHFCLFSSI